MYYIHFIDAINELSDDEKNATTTNTHPAPDAPEKNHLASQAVKDYLMQVDSWGEMELKLYAFFSFSFSPATTYQLFKTAIKRSKVYQSLGTDQMLIFDILHNNFSAFLYYGRLDWAQETLTVFDDQFSQTNLLGPHIIHLADKAILAIRLKNFTGAQTYLNKPFPCAKFLNRPKPKKRSA